ncbi:alpha/beta hydrolase [Aliagarivorans taiwanensis]|uniref:alpha/beta hydrolase n=1 Tax=Aliagarivorans taiwanensis TaxID=561966 RepID=UPI00146FB4FD|nr:alpha/beta fold hydrolase [Aliagarivorans taiwanensis]
MLLLIAAVLLGPRVDLATTSSRPALPVDLATHIAESEGRYHDIVAGTEKYLHWHGESHAQPPLSVVYLYGFSASRQETAPLSENLAKQLAANLFATRFTGHGREHPDAMSESSVQRWLEDGYEALAIGEAIGEGVVLLGVSTGATIATWLATQAPEQLAALVLISPNFGPADPGARALLWPWGEQLAKLATGERRSWQAQNALQHRYWTTSYPTESLLPMMGLVELITPELLASVEVPVLVIYSPLDQVVDPQATERAFQQLGSPIKQLTAYTDARDPGQHVLAGRVLSPDSTEAVEQIIEQFLHQKVSLVTALNAD